MKKLITILAFVVLSGCATQSNDELLKGELYSSTVKFENSKEFEQKTRDAFVFGIKDTKIYSFSVRFR